MASILFLLLLFSRFPVGNNFVKTINKIKVERGRSVTIPCHYDQKHKDHVKCWCKGETWESCSVTKCSDSPQSEGEVSITDVPDLLLFTVTVRNLQQKDSDWYWCGVEIDGVKDEAEYLTIEVTADIKGVRTENWVSAERGGSVTIPCQYDQKYKYNVKYWCKGETPSSCSPVVCSDSPQSEGEVSITDVPDQLLFTVTMRNLQQNDSGWYWCGVKNDDAEDEYAYLYLTVTTGVMGVMTENWVSAETGGSVNISCRYEHKYKDHVKYWCRGFTWSPCSPVVRSDSPHSEGEVSITDVPHQLLFTVTMRNLQQNDSGWYWCGVKNDDAEDEYAYLYLTVTTGKFPRLLPHFHVYSVASFLSKVLLYCLQTP
ncbi:polymeric immunoglobulin receptor-like [Arapaima gigas]